MEMTIMANMNAVILMQHLIHAKKGNIVIFRLEVEKSD